MDAMKDIKSLLDGAGAAADAAPAILETRNGTCTEHGQYLDQKTTLRTYSGLKPITLPFWLGCPECRTQAELANQQEAKQWTGLIPGEPSWSKR